MNFNRVFHYFHHPFWGVNTPIFGLTPKMFPVSRRLVHLGAPALVGSLERESTKSVSRLSLGSFPPLKRTANSSHLKKWRKLEDEISFPGWWFQRVLLIFHPQSLGKLSNLTSIFFKWMTQPPTSFLLGPIFRCGVFHRKSWTSMVHKVKITATPWTSFLVCVFLRSFWGKFWEGVFVMFLQFSPFLKTKTTLTLK